MRFDLRDCARDISPDVHKWNSRTGVIRISSVIRPIGMHCGAYIATHPRYGAACHASKPAIGTIDMLYCREWCWDHFCDESKDERQYFSCGWLSREDDRAKIELGVWTSLYIASFEKRLPQWRTWRWSSWEEQKAESWDALWTLNRNTREREEESKRKPCVEPVCMCRMKITGSYLR